MRRVLILTGLVVVLAMTVFTAKPVVADTMCVTTCSASSLSCTPAISCSSVPGVSITCDSTTTLCSASDSWCACSNSCTNAYINCLETCGPSCGHCDVSFNHCSNACGTQPPNSSC